MLTACMTLSVLQVGSGATLTMVSAYVGVAQTRHGPVQKVDSLRATPGLVDGV
jgi:hypothetical protein